MDTPTQIAEIMDYTLAGMAAAGRPATEPIRRDVVEQYARQILLVAAGAGKQPFEGLTAEMRTAMNTAEQDLVFCVAAGIILSMLPDLARRTGKSLDEILAVYLTSRPQPA